MMKITSLLLIPLGAASFACSHSAPPLPVIPKPVVLAAASPLLPPKTTAIKPKTTSGQNTLKEIKLDTDLSTVGSPMDWVQVFSAISFSSPLNPKTLGFSQRVASFGSADALKADSVERLKLVAEVPLSKKGNLANEMVKRVTSQLDFAKHDLIAVYLTVGDLPSGEYRYSLVDNTMEFCVDKVAHAHSTSSLPLKNIVKFYAAPKGLPVKKCEREI